MHIQGKTIVVTGGGRGLGRAIALEFARHGGNLALLDLNAADLEETRLACAALGVSARTYLCNVTSEDGVIATMDAIVRDFGSLDVLVSNVGVRHRFPLAESTRALDLAAHPQPSSMKVLIQPGSTWARQ